MLKFIPPSQENLAISGSRYKLLSPDREVTSFKLRQAGIVRALEAGDLWMGIRVHTPRLMTVVTNIRGERGRGGREGGRERKRGRERKMERETERERERERERKGEWKGRGTGEGEVRTERRGREGTSQRSTYFSRLKKLSCCA